MDGNLYQCPEDREVDMFLGSNVDIKGNLWVVAESDSQPYYIVIAPDSQEVLDGMNMVLDKIMDSNLNFAEERYNANFPDSGIENICLDDEEQAYIYGEQKVSVVVVKEWHPLFGQEEDTDTHNGLIPDALEEVTEFLELGFSYEYANIYGDALNLAN